MAAGTFTNYRLGRFGDAPPVVAYAKGTNIPYLMGRFGSPMELQFYVSGVQVEGEIDETMEFDDSSTGATPTFFEDEIDEGAVLGDTTEGASRKELFDNTYFGFADGADGEIAENPLSGIIEDGFTFETRLGEWVDAPIYDFFWHTEEVLGQAGDLIEDTISGAARFGDGSDWLLRPGVRVAETLVLDTQFLPYFAKRVTEALKLASPAIGNYHINLTLTDTVGFRDRIKVGVPASLVEQVGVSAVVTALNAVKIIERLGLTETLVMRARRVGDVTERLRLRDTLKTFFGAEVSEMIGVDSDLDVVYHAIVTLLENVQVATVATPMVAFRCDVREGLQLDDDALLNMIWNGTVEDGVEFSMGYFGTDGEFTGWAMNTRTSAVTEYQNFAFNSFARMGHIYLGASSTGLYELRGDDDAGEDVVSIMRGGYMQFGGPKLSRLKEAYISVRAPNAEVYLKIETADGDTYTYLVDTRSMRNTKVHMGKGQRARYFLYELTSTGQDFDLDTIEFVPIVVQRRV